MQPCAAAVTEWCWTVLSAEFELRPDLFSGSVRLHWGRCFGVCATAGDVYLLADLLGRSMCPQALRKAECVGRHSGGVWVTRMDGAIEEAVSVDQDVIIYEQCTYFKLLHPSKPHLSVILRLSSCTVDLVIIPCRSSDTDLFLTLAIDLGLECSVLLFRPLCGVLGIWSERQFETSVASFQGYGQPMLCEDFWVRVVGTMWPGVVEAISVEKWSRECGPIGVHSLEKIMSDMFLPGNDSIILVYFLWCF